MTLKQNKSVLNSPFFQQTPKNINPVFFIPLDRLANITNRARHSIINIY